MHGWFGIRGIDPLQRIYLCLPLPSSPNVFLQEAPRQKSTNIFRPLGLKLQWLLRILTSPTNNHFWLNMFWSDKCTLIQKSVHMIWVACCSWWSPMSRNQPGFQHVESAPEAWWILHSCTMLYHLKWFKTLRICCEFNVHTLLYKLVQEFVHQQYV